MTAWMPVRAGINPVQDTLERNGTSSGPRTKEEAPAFFAELNRQRHEEQATRYHEGAGKRAALRIHLRMMQGKRTI